MLGYTPIARKGILTTPSCCKARESQGKQRYDKIRLVPFAEYFPFLLLNKIWSKISLGTYPPAQIFGSLILQLGYRRDYLF